MAEETQLDETATQASVHLGNDSKYPTKYDPTQLVKIERQLNRTQYGIKENALAFTGYDVWNCYEMATMTESGEPVHFVGQMIVPADSKYIVESKSMKLYTFSFNMSRFGKDPEECIKIVTKLVAADLSELLQCDIKFANAVGGANHLWNSKFHNLMHLNFSDKFTEFTEEPLILRKRRDDRVEPEIAIKFNHFRSNCRVTNQPDFANIAIFAKDICIDMKSLHEYLVSFRNESHFHEEVIETIFTRLNDKFEHNGLLVIGFYTRRGGIDIVPVRASSDEMLKITEAYEFSNPSVLLPRMIQQ